ncbi:MAG TPA: DUF4123 domain-containing protein [Marinobacter sp.]|jgi:hypothetical protein|nr:DUF4123 domain-containing protein [Marinobacter sp.]
MADQRRKRYLILEGRSASGLLRSIYRYEDDPAWDYLFTDTEWESYRDHGPLIVAALQDSDLYRWALGELKKSVDVIGVIIESDGTLTQVADWWRKRLRVKLDRTRTALLRLYDPVIWSELEPTDTGTQGLIERVIYWSGEGKEGRWYMSYNPEPVTMTEPPTLEPGQQENLGLLSA